MMGEVKRLRSEEAYDNVWKENSKKIFPCELIRFIDQL